MEKDISFLASKLLSTLHSFTHSKNGKIKLFNKATTNRKMSFDSKILIKQTRLSLKI